MTDYDLPAEWASMSDEQRSEWLTRERCRRQAERQSLHAYNEVKRLEERWSRRMDARSETVSLDNWR